MMVITVLGVPGEALVVLKGQMEVESIRPNAAADSVLVKVAPYAGHADLQRSGFGQRFDVPANYR